MYESYREYFAFMAQLGQTLDRLTELAKEKTAAVRRDDLLAVDECMKQEQALSLTLRVMDKKRETLLAAMGLRDVSLSGLAQHCPEELRQEARAAAEDLRDRYALYRSAADVARTTLECNLHQIDKMLADEAEAPVSGGTIADIRA
ncbi:MAG: flagellar export chaperone FlgN [Oscillospiraceae bacterium]|nr:flagellar export chaperone FlgN [Oscillospiraceae bacterium]